jgi:hypothetical protein
MASIKLRLYASFSPTFYADKETRQQAARKTLIEEREPIVLDTRHENGQLNSATQ